MTQKQLPEYLNNSLQNTLRIGYMFVICYFVVICINLFLTEHKS